MCSFNITCQNSTQFWTLNVELLLNSASLFHSTTPFPMSTFNTSMPTPTSTSTVHQCHHEMTVTHFLMAHRTLWVRLRLALLTPALQHIPQAMIHMLINRQIVGKFFILILNQWSSPYSHIQHPRHMCLLLIDNALLLQHPSPLHHHLLLDWNHNRSQMVIQTSCHHLWLALVGLVW